MQGSYAIPMITAVIGGLLGAISIEKLGFSPWQGDHAVGIPFGIIAALWCWYPFHYKFHESRGSLLHPDWYHYPVNLQTAFRGVRDVLEGAVIDMGDQWHIEADTNERTIKAQIRFFDEETSHDPGMFANIQSKTQSVKRFMQLIVQFYENADDTTAIAYDFYPFFEGKDLFPCDRVINKFNAAVEKKLGTGTLQDSPRKPIIAAPPVWLIGITLAGECFLFFRIIGWITG